jgi:ArsR family transcriptional regulator, arsenate/arsenite/antimonite-responsive transcriptional repressor
MTETAGNELSENQVQLIAKALADPRRYEILQKLRRRDQALPCEAVRGYMEISPATLSHHMKELEMAGLIKVIREGKFASYLLRQDVLKAFFARLKSDLI